jgi:DNA polymerase I-like protein with 3'-5' exonuclease and polymerase domains
MNLLFLGTEEDRKYAPRLKSIIGSGHSTYVIFVEATTLTEILVYCKTKGITGVICTQAQLIPKLSGETYANGKVPSLDAYTGSMFHKDGIDFVFINPLDHLFKVSYGTFLASRFISKLTKADSWHHATPFSWEIANESTIEKLYNYFSTAYAIAADIETALDDSRRITCVGYTGIFLEPSGAISTHSIVIPFTSEFFVAWVRRFGKLDVPKIFQNGKYDNAYLSRYDCVHDNWLWDTATQMHCWYTELPKDLAFLNAFFVREARYWKHEAQASNTHDYYLYNAHDTHATANAWISWMLEAPEWARRNYLMEFPLNFPCHLAEMTGIKVDLDKVAAVSKELNATIEEDNRILSIMLGTTGFNVNSPKQVRQMLDVLGCKDIKKGDEKALKRAGYRHPLNYVICNKVLKIRGDRKIVSSYLKPTISFDGRVLYSLNPHGTDTGRLASKEHHFWCGLQIQNISSDGPVKEAFIADPGFLMAEADFEQAESRGSAYISGDENLIAAVESGKDFHSTNAAAFFGVPYDSIFDDASKKTIDKPIRDLAKRTNHGATYNMGPDVLVDTMGEENVARARALLKLPRLWTLRQVAEYLLNCFAKTYPRVKKDYYDWVKYQVMTTNLLVGATGWVRYCFGNPTANKLDLNSYVAHCPQSLNAVLLNHAFMRVFYEVWMPNQRDFKLYAQIHDSIFFAYREGRIDLAYKVKECMENPIKIKDVSGIERTLLVPAALKLGGPAGAVRWSDCK